MADHLIAAVVVQVEDEIVLAVALAAQAEVVLAEALTDDLTVASAGIATVGVAIAPIHHLQHVLKTDRDVLHEEVVLAEVLTDDLIVEVIGRHQAEVASDQETLDRHVVVREEVDLVAMTEEVVAIEEAEVAAQKGDLQHREHEHQDEALQERAHQEDNIYHMYTDKREEPCLCTQKNYSSHKRVVFLVFHFVYRMSFVHLHWHSHYSLLEAFGEPKAIIARAKELGMSAITLTDYNGMYGAIEFYQAAQKAGIKAIFGVELGFVQDRMRKEKNENAGNIVLLAKDKEGYQHLMSLTTKAHIEGFNKKARIDDALLREHGMGLVAIMWGAQSRLGATILQKEDTKKIYERIQMLQEMLGKENIYGEIIVQDEALLPNVKEINTWLRTNAEPLGLALICASNFHYPRPDDKELYEILLCIKEWQRFMDREKQQTLGDRSIHSEDDIKKILTKNTYSPELIDSLITTTASLAEQLNVEIKLGQMLFPKYTSSEEITRLYEEHKNELIVAA